MKFLTILLLALLAFPVQAEEQAYTVKNIKITLGTGSPNKLREKALTQATQQGFKTLLKKLTPPSYWPRHAWLISAINPESALEKTNIVKEETIPKYSLTVDLTFNRPTIRKLLTKHSVPFSEVESTTALIIPIYEPAGMRVLWEPVNPWRDALKTKLLREGSLNFTLPAGDMAEISMLTADMAAFGAKDVLLQIAKAYGTDTVIVARIEPQATYLKITANWHRAQDDRKLPAINFNMPLIPANTTTSMQTAANKLLIALENTWRKSAMVAADKPASIFLRFNPKTLEELAIFRKTITGFSAVNKVIPKLISKTEAVYEVNFFGNINTLKTQLTGLNYTMWRDGHMWRVRKK